MLTARLLRSSTECQRLKMNGWCTNASQTKRAVAAASRGDLSTHVNGNFVLILLKCSCCAAKGPTRYQRQTRPAMTYGGKLSCPPAQRILRQSDVTRFRKVNTCAAVEANLFLSTWRDELVYNLIIKNNMLSEARDKQPQNPWDAPDSWRPSLATSAITGFRAMTEEVVYYSTISCAFPKNNLISTYVHLENQVSVIIPAEPQTFFAMMKGLCMCCSTQMVKRSVFAGNVHTSLHNQARFMHPYTLTLRGRWRSPSLVHGIPFTQHLTVTIRIHS